jgi:4-amino-4-deoxy-L-arabinose transferase-like glycosyltransferase
MSRPRALSLLALLIGGTALVRLLMAAELGLGIDESYMVAAGRTLHLSYFDHPPLAWWLSRWAAMLLGSEQPLAVRLPFVALFAVSTWLVFRIGELAGSPAGGLWAAVAVNLAPVLGITTGFWVLPDGPLDCALLGAGCCLMRALPGEDRSWGWWLGAGGCAGLALLSKYSAVLTLAGAAAYLASSPVHRRWLRRPQPWVAAALALVLFAPVVVWNAQHQWASLAFQGGRATTYRLNLAGPLVVLAGAALYLLPWIWAGLVAALVRGLRAGPRAWRSWLLCWLGLPPIVLFAVVSLWSRQVLFHWAAPGYLLLFPLFGAELARLGETRPRLLRGAAVASVALVAFGLLVVAAEMRWNWISTFAPGRDPGLQALDWTPLRGALDDRGLLHRPDTVIAGTSWSVTGKLDYALGGDPPVLCFDTDARQFGFAPGPAAHLGQDVLLLGPRIDRPSRYGGLFDSVEPLPLVMLRLPGRPETPIAAVLGHHLRTWP